MPPSFPINARYDALQDGNYPVVDLRDLRNVNFITYRTGRNMTKLLIDQCAGAGFVPKVVIKCSSADSVNTMIASGMGVGFMPGIIPDFCPTDQRAVYYRLQSGIMIRHFYIVSRKTSGSAWHSDNSWPSSINSPDGRYRAPDLKVLTLRPIIPALS